MAEIKINPPKGIEHQTFKKNPLTGLFEKVRDPKQLWKDYKVPIMIAGAVSVGFILFSMKKKGKRK